MKLNIEKIKCNIKIILLIYIAVVISFMAIKQYKTQRQTLWDICYASAEEEIARQDKIRKDLEALNKELEDFGIGKIQYE